MVDSLNRVYPQWTITRNMDVAIVVDGERCTFPMTHVWGDFYRTCIDGVVYQLCWFM